MTGLFYTEKLTDSQILSTELTVESVDEEELSLCTAYLELVALFYMIAAAGKRLFTRIFRWTTGRTGLSQGLDEASLKASRH